MTSIVAFVNNLHSLILSHLSFRQWVEILVMEESVIPEQLAKLRCVNSLQAEIVEAPENKR